MNCSLPLSLFYYFFSFLLLVSSINSMGKFVTHCDRKRDKVTSRGHVTCHVIHSLVGSVGY